MKCVLFDMDGVLTNSMDAWLLTSQRFLEKYEKESVTREEFIEKWWGKCGLTQSRFPEASEKRINELRQEQHGGLIDFAEHVHVYEDVVEALEGVDAKKCVVTSTTHAAAEEILRNKKLLKFFEFVVGAEDTDKRKPDPEPVLLACKKLGVEPQDAWYVGDTETDIKASTAAGCKTVIIDRAGKGFKGVIVIKDLRELLEIVK